jgi:hypothetical protein
MLGPIVIAAGLACLAFLCAFVIEYEEALHRFPKSRARRYGLRSGVFAAAFFRRARDGVDRGPASLNATRAHVSGAVAVRGRR